MTGRRAAVTAAVVAAVLAVVAVLAGLSRPATPQSAPTVLAATTGSPVRAALFCPDLRRGAGVSTQVVTGTTDPGAGSVTLAAVTATRGAATVLGPGRAVATYGGPVTGPVTLRASGALTPGVVAEQISHAESGSERGWSEARCDAASADQWFVGASTAAGDAPVVTLANPGDARAIATVTVLTPSGLVAAAAGDNVVVPAHGVVRLGLVSLAPGATATAVHVETESGEVAAAVRDLRGDGTVSLGTDWVPQGAPAASLTVSGIPGSFGGQQPARTLYLADPDPAPATVQVTVTGATGSFVPTGLDAVAVPPLSVVAVSLDKALGSGAGTVTTVSEAGISGAPARVVAGVGIDVGMTNTADAEHDVAYLGAVPPLAAAGLVPVVRVGSGLDSVLVLSAPGPAASARIVVRRPDGGTTTRTIAVGAGRTVTQSLAALQAPDGSSVTVTPAASAGPLYVARVIEQTTTGGPEVSAYQVTGRSLAVPVPAVGELPLGAH